MSSFYNTDTVELTNSGGICKYQPKPVLISPQSACIGDPHASKRVKVLREPEQAAAWTQMRAAGQEHPKACELAEVRSGLVIAQASSEEDGKFQRPGQERAGRRWWEVCKNELSSSV